MDYSMRTIAYLAELIHPPRQHGQDAMQRIHSVAFGDDSCKYQNFALIPGGATLSNPQTTANTISAVTFLPDRLQIREEMTGISREDFQQRLLKLATLSFEVLGVEQFMMQNFIVRSLVNPRNFQDSREFISRSILNMEDEDFACLGRKPEIVGVRMVFPQTAEARGVFNVRVESYAAEPRSLFIENTGVFRSLVNPTNASEITSNMFETYEYIDGNVIDFMSQFDGKIEEEPPEEL